MNQPISKNKPDRRNSGFVGPLVGWELFRLARRGQDMRARFILAVTFLIVLTMFTLVWFYQQDPYEVFFGHNTLSIEESAKFGESFSLAFLFCQMFVMVLLTPAYAAGGISEEKEKKTFIYLLVSDLTSRELFLGKFVGRMTFLLGIMFAGLPILSMTQLYGGVSINLLLAAYMLTAATVILHSAIAAASAMATDTYRGALFRSYGVAALHCVIGFGHPVIGPFGVLSVLYMTQANPGWFWIIAIGYPAIELVLALGAILLGIRWTRRMRAKPGRNPKPPRSDLRDDPTPAPTLVILDTPTDSSQLLTAKLLSHDVAPEIDEPAPRFRGSEKAPEPVVDEPRLRRRRKPPPVRTPLPPEVLDRPKLGEKDPFMWKERYTTGRKNTVDDDSIRGIAVAVGIAAGVAFGFLAIFTLMALLFTTFSDGSRAFATKFFLFSGSVGYFVYLLMAGMTACSAIVGERQRNTLESLLAIPVDRMRILGPKARMAAEKARWWGIPSAICIPFGLIFSESPILAIPMAGFVIAGFALTITYGLTLSIRVTTATKATMWLLPVIASLTLIPLILAGFGGPGREWYLGPIGLGLFALVSLSAYYFWHKAKREFEDFARL
ncbi:MAG: ABC transporter permease [Fimbriiglobus sp.]